MGSSAWGGMIEERYGLAHLSSRDAAVNSLSDVFAAKQYEAER